VQHVCVSEKHDWDAGKKVNRQIVCIRPNRQNDGISSFGTNLCFTPMMKIGENNQKLLQKSTNLVSPGRLFARLT
jgi:hypothetical protein